MADDKPKNEGVFGKYVLKKADGSKIDSEACYFILRLDTDRAARRAMGQYARSIRKENEKLADDIEGCIKELEQPTRPDCGCREAMCPHSISFMFSHVWRAGQ